MRDSVLWRKQSRLIMLLADSLQIDAERALDLFYTTEVYQQLSNPKYGLHLMSDDYILENLIDELRNSQWDKKLASTKKVFINLKSIAYDMWSFLAKYCCENPFKEQGRIEVHIKDNPELTEIPDCLNVCDVLDLENILHEQKKMPQGVILTTVGRKNLGTPHFMIPRFFASLWMT